MTDTGPQPHPRVADYAAIGFVSAHRFRRAIDPAATRAVRCFASKRSNQSSQKPPRGPPPTSHNVTAAPPSTEILFSVVPVR
jgi:hypothetical protein